MELRNEKSFPRGGRKPALFKSRQNSSLSFLGKTRVKPKKKTSKLKQSERKKIVEKPPKTLKREEFKVKYVEDLKTSTVHVDMLVLGIIAKVTENHATVSLPGRLRGIITIANVSEFYSSIIENSSKESEVSALTEVLQVGNVLPVKVLSTSEKPQCFMVTCDPKKINEKLSYNMIEKGLILSGNVKSREEHGFVIDFGIRNINAFLKLSKINESQELNIGQVIRCCVIQADVSPGCCNVQLSILKKDFESSCVSKNTALPVYCFIPGFQFQVTVKKLLLDGVEVSCSEHNFPKGFIYEDHFPKKFSSLKDLEIGTTVISTLLYVKPLVNFLYFKIMPKKDLDCPFGFGEIVSGKVIKVRKAGVFFKIIDGCRKAKCFVPVLKLKNAAIFQDKSEILNLYPLGKKVSKIRLGPVDLMGRFYMGATDKASINEKYYSISDVKIGQIISCKISGFGKSSAELKIGKTIKGIVPFADMSDRPIKNPTMKFKVGQKVKARVANIIPNKLLVYLTMKPTLLNEKEILCDTRNYKKGHFYTGTVTKVIYNKIIVKFFNGIFGVVPKSLTPYLDAKSLADHFYKGQLVKCIVQGVLAENKLNLSLVKNTDVELQLGKKYKVMVVNKTEKGLFLDVFIDKNTKCRGYLPTVLLTLHRSLAPALHSTYFVGEKMSAFCVVNDIKLKAPVFGAEEIFNDIYNGKTEEELSKLFSEDTVLPFLFRNKSRKTNVIYLKSLIPGTTNVFVEKSDFTNFCPLLKYQVIYGKILNVKNSKARVSTQLCDVWDKDFNTSLSFLNSYLKAMNSLISRQKSLQNIFSGDIYLGCSVKGVIEEVKPNHAIVRTEDGDLGIVNGTFQKGEDIYGKIIWVDAPEQIFYVKSINCDTEDSKSNEEKLLLQEEFDIVRGKVIFINQEVIVCEMKGRGKGKLAFLPQRRHLNDMVNNKCIVSLGEELKLRITKKNSDYFLAMDHRIVALQEKVIWKKSETKLKETVESLKRTLESEKIERLKKRKRGAEEEDIEIVKVKLMENGKNTELIEVKEEIEDDKDELQNASISVTDLDCDDVEIKSEGDAEENDKDKFNKITIHDERIDLSSSLDSEDDEEEEKEVNSFKAFKVGFNWDVTQNNFLLSGVRFNEDESSSLDEESDTKHDKKKRRRLTAIEKKDKAKNEEERLRFVEKRFVDTEREPETADDFDRAVLASPNSSSLWLKYMAFHVQGTEIEKARAVARRALKAISFREEQEKLNIWIALLNLENMYGTEDSLSKILHEALQINDPYKIHLHMLSLHGQNNRLQEMEKLGNFMLKKYKEVKQLWLDVSSVYFGVGKVESARNVLQKALTVMDKSQHVPLISKFAQLENKFGSPERAQTLYESILASFPKRTDIWSCYVDMLVKSNHIDLARQVLERATSQSLRPRKMKTLFKKFIAFEETYGNPENVEKVREAAVEYVQTLGSLNN